MSGNERKRQKRGDQDEKSRRKSGDASDNVVAKAHRPHLPKLPAVVWGKHIAPFLHRKDLNNLLAQGGKEIYEACKDLKFPWPTVELHLPGITGPEVQSSTFDSPITKLLRAITPDSKWIIVAPVTHLLDSRWYPWIRSGSTDLYVFHSRYGRARDVVPLTGRTPRNSQESPKNRYYPKQISISKDGQYLAVCYHNKVEVDLFRVAFYESKEPSARLELHRTFELDTTTTTSPFRGLYQSCACNFALSTNSKWIIVGYDGMGRAVVAWEIETGAIVKSEVGGIEIFAPYHHILATDSMILWLGNYNLSFCLRAWKIERGKFSPADSTPMLHPENDPSRSELTHELGDPNISFSKLVASPIDPSTFIANSMELPEDADPDDMDPFFWGDTHDRIDLLKLNTTTDGEVTTTTVQKLRQLADTTSYPKEMDICWYPDGQDLLLHHSGTSKFHLMPTSNDSATGHGAPRNPREDLVDKADIIPKCQVNGRVRNFELSPDGEFLVVQLDEEFFRGGFRGPIVVSQCCGNKPEDIKRRMFRKYKQ